MNFPNLFDVLNIGSEAKLLLDFDFQMNKKQNQYLNICKFESEGTSHSPLKLKLDLELMNLAS